MLKKQIVIGVLLVLSLLIRSHAQVKKYGIKSGIVTFELALKMGDMNMVSKSVVTFDDYGLKERKDTYSDDQLKETFFSDGKELYLVIYAENTAYKRGPAYNGTEYKVSWEELSRGGGKSLDAIKLANIEILGKDCESYQIKSNNSTTVFAGWQGICLLMDTTTSGINSVLKAVKFEENVPISSDMFKVPAGFATKS